MRKNNMKTIEEKLEMINRYKSGESATKIVKENAINKREQIENQIILHIDQGSVYSNIKL